MALEAFRKGEIRVLIATDIAARGIDVSGVSHVINYELPNVPEQYVHRIGRTARAGADGIAISFVAGDEKGFLKQIERLTRVQLSPMPLPADFAAILAKMPKPAPRAAEPTHARRGDRPQRHDGGRHEGARREGAHHHERDGEGQRKRFRPQRRTPGVGTHKAAVKRVGR
jgi:ATP-dependent RNA helicase RhlE